MFYFSIYFQRENTVTINISVVLTFSIAIHFLSVAALGVVVSLVAGNNANEEQIMCCGDDESIQRISLDVDNQICYTMEV